MDATKVVSPRKLIAISANTKKKKRSQEYNLSFHLKT